MVSITCFRQVCEILQGLFFLPPPLMGKIWGTMILMIVLQDIIWLFCKKCVGWSRIVPQKRFWLLCKNYFIVLREILTIVLQEISGFEIFSAQLLLAFSLPTFFAPAKLILQFTKLSPRRSFKSFTILGKIFEIYYGQQIHSYCAFVWRKNEPKIPFVKKNDTCEVWTSEVPEDTFWQLVNLTSCKSLTHLLARVENAKGLFRLHVFPKL